jgi:hypothetical protein
LVRRAGPHGRHFDLHDTIPGMNEEGSISRRDFVKTASLAATALTTGLALNATSASAAPSETQTQAAPAKPMIGFQVEVTYLLQYGIVKFLDDVQTRASVNTLMLHGNPFEASWAWPGQGEQSGRQLCDGASGILSRHQNAAAALGSGRLQPPRRNGADHRRNEKARGENNSLDGGGQPRAPGDQGDGRVV